ncbi:hypothetical protein [Pseudomonas putida]|uniref:Uncharacterized protein n=1 Tax=Pseudomonas putida TaxID=303 RepID=A0A8I1EP70_PSEPU|nr:hypothetical protein [Pseudomonas putida]MBI6888664.1 hypothetical protein [Pseudomonas putida]
MGADGFGYFGHDQSNPPEGRKGDYAPPSRMNTYLMWMLTSKKQEARSKKQEARSKKQEARSKKQEARSKKQEARSKKQGARSKERSGLF